MTNGKSSSNQRSDSTQTFELEDRNYYVWMGAIYTKDELDFLYTNQCISKYYYEAALKRPAVTNHWWMQLVHKGYKMIAVHMKRDGSVLKTTTIPGVRLFGPKRIPWTFMYHGDVIVAESLSKDEAQAVAYADRKRIENFLNPKWLALIAEKHNEIEVSF